MSEDTNTNEGSSSTTENTSVELEPSVIQLGTTTLRTLNVSKDEWANIREDNKVNEKVAEKHVEFENMIYIGDGITDIPCMTLIKERDGLSIAVYKSGRSETAQPLVFDRRVDAAVTADYREGSKLDKLVKAKIDMVSLCLK